MTPSAPRKILVIEDEAHIAEGLKLNLTLQGHAVQVAADGPTGIELWETFQPDLIVLDVMLPVIDGLTVLHRIRLRDEDLPVLIVSAKNSPMDRVKGFQHGVDDYLTKPFNLDEFLLRVERLLRRADRSRPTAHRPPERYRFGPNSIDFGTATAHGMAGSIRLTDQEIKLLKILIANRGRIVSRQTLLSQGWGYTQGTTTRTVDNFIVRLRRYFEKDPQNPQYFKSLRAMGYMFDHP
jgi:DNA-binding response OmpR family regulator